MGLFKRGKTWWILYYVDRERMRESSRSDSKECAKKLLAKRKAEIFEGRFDIRSVRPSPRFKAWVDVYLEDYSRLNKRRKTHERDKSLAAHLVKAFGKKRLDEVKPFTVEHYKKARCEKAAPGTVNRELAL